MAVFHLALLFSGAAAAAVRPQHEALVQVTPVQKVITMLNDMMAKGKKEMQDEQVSFATFKQFCKSTSVERAQAIETTQGEVDSLTADIAKSGELMMKLEKEIAAHDADIAAWTTEKDEATFEREKEHADFVTEHQDYTASISSVERAVETIKAGAHDVAGGASLLEKRAVLHDLGSLSKVPEEAKKVISSFLQGPSPRLESDLLEVEAPGAAKAFESSSGGVLEMVEGMGEKMEDKRDEVEKEEMNKKHGYDMMMQDLTDQIETNQATREKKASQKAEAGESKSQAEGALAAAQQSLKEDTKFLSDLNQECTQKSAEFDKRQEVRQGEIEAITKAIEIMSGSAIQGGSSYLPGFVQKSANFAQLRAVSATSSLQRSVAEFLRGRASRANSRLLSLMATRVSEDPFKKVGKMIKDMIGKLMQEATEEAEHKGFCDTELTTNKQTRDSKSEEAEELTALTEKLDADVKLLGAEIATLGEEISAIDDAMAKATTVRQDEKAKNTATIEDAKVAQAATAQAMTVLKEFYDKAASATAMSQQKASPGGAISYDDRALTILDRGSLLQVKSKVPGAPETGAATYTGMGNGGVMGMLEVIESDFARLLAETTAAEQEAAAEFEKFSSDSAEDKAVKSTESRSKTGEKTRKQSALSSAKKDLATTKEELAAAMDYYEKLKPSCVEAGVSYEERVAQRKEEIESLQEALKILSTDTE